MNQMLVTWEWVSSTERGDGTAYQDVFPDTDSAVSMTDEEILALATELVNANAYGYKTVLAVCVQEIKTIRRVTR